MDILIISVITVKISYSLQVYFSVIVFPVEEHYGMNRYNRRTVREDIPVAKVVQTQEEIEQQKERLRKLAALQAQ